MGWGTLFDIALPRQDLSQFNHFPPGAEDARAWATQLPVTNIRAVSAQLLAALGDLNRYPLRPEDRADILESLADYLRVTLTNLTRRFLNQPLVMPPEPQRLAERAESLLAQMQTAYTIVALETHRSHEHIRDRNPARLLGEALYQAIICAGRRILLALQLHRPTPIGSWLSLHRLYALAEWQDLADLVIQQTGDTNHSIKSAYLQALLLGCSKPNQLLQSDLEAVYRALGEWHTGVEIGPAGEFAGLFSVDLGSDQPAVYSALYGEAGGNHRRVINCEALVHKLRALRDPEGGYEGQGVRLECGLQLPDAMLAHLIESLGSMSMRTFKRINEDAPVLVSIGISGAHYHAAGEQSFQQLLYGRDNRPELFASADSHPFSPTTRSSDIWDSGNPGARFDRGSHGGHGGRPEVELSHNIELDIFTRSIIEELELPPTEHEVPVHRVRQRNASPGGYCLEWEAGLAEDIRSGELLSIQENPRASWSIATVRWISRLENSRTLVGVELLSPRATACGVQQWQKVGASRAPQRGLLLPEINLIGQPQTLVTPRTGFREGTKVSLLRHGEVRHVQLQRQLSATASFAQFEFRDIRRLDEVLADNRRRPLDSIYDSVWSNI